MTEKAKKVWDIAVANGMAIMVDYMVDDLEAFAETVDCDDQRAVIIALYELFEKH